MTDPAGPILIGTCNWADHRQFYPQELEHGRAQREKLSWYARYFPVVEIDTSFYGIPRVPVVQSWVEKTPPDFVFNIKAYRSLTGHERDAEKRIRPAGDDEIRDFLECLKPLRDSGKLRAVHYQFPPWFTDRPDHRERIVEARERHPDDLVAVEFRHRSWFEDWPRTEELLRELGCVFVGVDAPQIGDATAPAHLAVTNDRLSIVRFHGRNRKTWYHPPGPTSVDRFDYLYRPEELRQWVPTIREAARRGSEVHVLLNNNRSNYAAVNAFDIAALLDVRLPRPPEPVLERIREREGRLPGWVEESQPPAGDELQAAPAQADLPL